MRCSFKLEAAHLSLEFGFKDIDAGKNIGTLVFRSDNLAARYLHGCGNIVFVAMSAVDFGDDDFSDNILFAATGQIAVELSNALFGVLAEAVRDFIVAAANFDFIDHEDLLL